MSLCGLYASVCILAQEMGKLAQAVLAVAGAASLLSAARAVQPVPLPLGIHLFTDFYLVSESQNLTVAMHPARKLPVAPVVVPDTPWDAVVYFYTSVLTVGTQVRLYYACLNSYSPTYVCVATSDDLGVTFTKPALPYYPWTNGSSTNRVFQVPLNASFYGTVFEVPTAEPLCRFWLSYESVNRTMAYVCGPDGFQFPTVVGPAEGLPELFADTQPVLLPASGNGGGGWAAFGREDYASYQCPNSLWGNFRRVLLGGGASSLPSGPFNFTTQALYIDPPLDPLICYDPYNAAAFWYGDAVLLFPAMSYHRPGYENTAPGGNRSQDNDAIMDIRLAAGRSLTAGASFQYVSRQAFLPRGIGTVDPVSLLYNGTGSDLDAGFLFFSTGYVDPTPVAPGTSGALLSNRISLFYWGTQATHAWNGELFLLSPGAFFGILRADIRRDGFASLSSINDAAQVVNGTFRTVPLLLPSAAECAAANHSQTGLLLATNTETTTAGALTVAVLNATSGLYIPGFSPDEAVLFKGNQIRVPSAWNRSGVVVTDLSPLRGTPIQLEFNLSHADLYAWDLQCA
jgi:hypothetical protein